MMMTGPITRCAKVCLLAATAFYFTLVVFGNITDYGANFMFVKHVLEMDTTYQSPSLMWRSIKSPAAHHFFYWIIILWETVIALLCWVGAAKLYAHRGNASAFGGAKAYAIAGVLAGLLLWFFAFITIGGEWFAMWQSSAWTGQAAAFRMFKIGRASCRERV